MNLDGFSSAFPALLDGLSVGEAAWQGRNGHDEVTSLVRFDHDGVGTHSFILSQGGSEILGSQTCLGQDRPEQTWPDRLSRVPWDSHASAAHRVLELGVRALLDHHPT